MTTQSFSDEDRLEPEPPAERVLADFSLPSEPGNERLAMQRVASSLEGLGLSPARLERVKTAVAETALNAMEHGNSYRPELLAEVKVLLSSDDLRILVTDQGGDEPIPDAPEPDLDAKLAGLQSPRGWGLFLIKSMVDEMHVRTESGQHIVELVFHRQV